MMAKGNKNVLNEETTSPPFRETVATLIEAIIKPEGFKRDLFFALLLVLMNENDFLLLNESADGTITIVDCITSLNKKNSDINEALLIFKGFQTLPVKLIQSPMGDVVMINAVIPHMSQRTYSICLPINKYIVTSELGLPAYLTNLCELSTLIKEKIIVPTKSTILNYCKFPSGSLQGLPTTVLHKILLMLPVEGVLNLSESCKRINEIVNEDSLWLRLYDRDFPDKHKTGNADVDYYRDMYKGKYLKVRENKARAFHESNLTQVEMSGYFMYASTPNPRLEVIL